MDLWSEFLSHQGRVIHKWAHYFPIYQKHFERFRGKAFTFVEIGCGEGGSMEMWKRFFGPFVQIVGLDIRPECKAFEDSQIAVRIGDQGDPAFLQSIVDEFGTPGIILDDGSHYQPHVMLAFAQLYDQVAADGLYVVEDLHTAYWPDHGGGLHASGSFIQRCKGLIDEINAEWARDPSLKTEFHKSTQSITFYDSVVVFEKSLKRRPVSFESGHGKVSVGFSP